MDREELKAILMGLLKEDAGKNLSLNLSGDGANSSAGNLLNLSNAYNRMSFEAGKSLVVVLASVGITANMASLFAMFHISGSFSANQRFIVNLVISDLFVSSVVLLHVANSSLFPIFTPGDDYGRRLCVYTVLKALVMMGHTISLLNLVVLAFDHFLAISKPLQYLNVFTGRRVTLTLAGIWIIGLLCGFSDFIVPGPEYSYCVGRDYVNFCEIGYCSRYETEYLLFPLAHVCFIVMVVFYSRVFVTIYKYQKMAGRHQRHMKRNIKGLVTTLIILGTFIVCWSPHCVFQAFFLLKILSDHIWVMKNYRLLLRVDYFMYALWVVNCVCDPIIYAVRMREVKHGYYRMAHCYLVLERAATLQRNSTLTSLYRRSVTTSITCEQLDPQNGSSPGNSAL